MRPHNLAILLLAAATGTAYAQEPAAATLLHQRPIPVAAPGWIRVRLDGLDQLVGASRGGWAVKGPDGRPVRMRVLEPILRPMEARAIEAKEQEDGSGYRLVFDLGPTPLLHHRLAVNLSKEVTAKGCRIEGSRDGREWRPLAEGDLFRLGAGEALQSTAIEYPASGDRYLRLLWPSGGGFPKFDSVSVEMTGQFPGGPTGAPLQIRPLEDPQCPASYVVEAPAGLGGFRSIVLDVEAGGPFRWSVATPADGAWTQVRSDTVKPETPGSPVRVVLEKPESLGPQQTLRVRLFPSAGGTATLKAAQGFLEPRWVLFQAGSAGEYSLLWAGPCGQVPVLPTLPLEEVKEPLADAVPGPMVPPAPPQVLSELSRPEPPSKEPWATARYGIAGALFRPGEVARLEIPPGVIGSRSLDRRNFRIRVEGRDVPFLALDLPEPALALHKDGLAARPLETGTEEGHRKSRIEVELPDSWPLVTGLEISTAAKIAPRQFSLHLERRVRPGVEHDAMDLPSFGIQENQEGPGPACSYSTPLRPDREAWGHLVLTVQDGGLEPISDLKLTLWRRRPALLFVWPEGSGLELLVLDGVQMAQVLYPLWKERPAILALPPRDAALDTEATAVDEAASERTRQIILTVSLAVAALVLLAILARSMRPVKPAGGQGSGPGGEVPK